MAETMGQMASATRNNTKVALGIFILALAPQLFEFIWSWGTLFGFGAGRGPAQVLTNHGAALLAGAPAVAPACCEAQFRHAARSWLCASGDWPLAG